MMDTENIPKLNGDKINIITVLTKLGNIPIKSPILHTNVSLSILRVIVEQIHHSD